VFNIKISFLNTSVICTFFYVDSRNTYSYYVFLIFKVNMSLFYVKHLFYKKSIILSFIKLQKKYKMYDAHITPTALYC